MYYISVLYRLGPEKTTQKLADNEPVGYGRHLLNPTPPLPDIGQTHDTRSNSYRKGNVKNHIVCTVYTTNPRHLL